MRFSSVLRYLLTPFLALFFLGASPDPANTKNMGSMYSDSTLSHWKTRYPKNITWNIRNVIFPKLTASERRKLASVNYEFPLRGTDGSPFSFYTFTGGRPRVVMPILSLKFWDDVSIAYAWLNRKGYSPVTVSDYMAMLKYRGAKDFGGRYPAPLKSLHIPTNALKNKDVDSLSQKLFKSAVIFILLHEMGHALHNHPGYGPGVPRRKARQNESQADSFGLEVMRRIGVAPVGSVFYFVGLAHGTSNRGDFRSDAAYDKFLSQTTHPLTDRRIKLIANRLRANAGDFGREWPTPSQGRQAISYIASELDRVANTLSNRGIQRLISSVGRKTTLRMLVPRRPGEKLGVPDDKKLTAVQAQAFHGIFDGRISQQNTTLTIRTILRRNGERVVGQYSYGTGEGRLVGLVRDGTMFFSWQEGRSRGHGALKLARDGKSFAGTWGFGKSVSNGGKWSGNRLRR